MNQKQKFYKTILRQKEISRRYYQRNWDAVRFCLRHGLVIYASAQSHNSDLVRLFIQKGENFKPMNDKLYSQSDEESMMEMIADMDERYEIIYLKMKDKEI